MELGDDRRDVLVRVVREPDWRPEVASVDGPILKELEAMGWVELSVDGFSYAIVVTERGLERHRAWGDERRGTRRKEYERIEAERMEAEAATAQRLDGEAA